MLYYSQRLAVGWQFQDVDNEQMTTFYVILFYVTITTGKGSYTVRFKLNSLHRFMLRVLSYFYYSYKVRWNKIYRSDKIF